MKKKIIASLITIAREKHIQQEKEETSVSKHMPIRFSATLLTITLLVIISLMSGCISSPESGTDRDGESIKTKQECFGSNSVEDAMKLIPKNDVSSFTYYNVETIRSDDDLDLYYNDIEIPSPLDEMISKKDVKYFATTEYYWYSGYCDEYGMCTINIKSSENDYSVVSGKFDLQRLENGLNDKGYTEDTYSDVTIMETDYKYIGLLSKNKILVAESKENIKDIIDVAMDKNDSLSDNNGFKSVSNKLSGFEIEIVENDYYYEGLELIGESIDKKNSRELALTKVYRFNSSNSAKDKIDGIEESFKETIKNTNGSFNIVEKDNQLIIAKGFVNTDEYFNYTH